MNAVNKEKSLVPDGNCTLTVQPVTRRYTDSATTERKKIGIHASIRAQTHEETHNFNVDCFEVNWIMPRNEETYKRFSKRSLASQNWALNVGTQFYDHTYLSCQRKSDHQTTFEARYIQAS
jgi:hypothetical protein